MGKQDSFRIVHDCFSIHFSNNTEKRPNRGDKKESDWCHYALFDTVADLLCKQCGFERSETPYDELVSKNYPSLWSDKCWGGNKHLRFEGHRYPAGFEFSFWYQESREGRKDNNGYFDFGKAKNSTTVERLVFTRAGRKVAALLVALGHKDVTEEKAVGYAGVKARIKSLQDFQGESYRYEKYKNESCFANQNARDREKKLVENGQVKYFRDYWSGRLQRGTVYHNINNMWWVVLNDFAYTNICCHELFDATPEDFAVRRKKKDTAKPHEKVRRKIGTAKYNEMAALGVEMKLKEGAAC